MPAVTIRVPRSRLAQMALVLLVVTAFGSLSVGLPLLALGGVGAVGSIALPFTAWGIASLVGAYGVWRIRRWAPWVVIPTQGIVAAALLYAYAGWARDGSVLLVAGIATGAAVLVALDVMRRRR